MWVPYLIVFKYLWYVLYRNNSVWGMILYNALIPRITLNDRDNVRLPFIHYTHSYWIVMTFTCLEPGQTRILTFGPSDMSPSSMTAERALPWRSARSFRICCMACTTTHCSELFIEQMVVKQYLHSEIAPPLPTLQTWLCHGARLSRQSDIALPDVLC